MDNPVRNSKMPSLKKLKTQSKSESDIGSSPEKTSKISVESSLSRLLKINLDMYCPKKLFYIVFVNESGIDSARLLDKFEEVGKNYETISSVTFITQEDVVNLMNTSNDYIFPNQLKPLLLDVIETIRQFGYDIPLIYQAQLLKLKLIQVMYEQYVAKVKQNRKEKNLEDLLNYLSRECKKKQKKDGNGQDPISLDKNKSPTREDTKKKTKKDDGKNDNRDEEIDYTSIPLENDGITFEENIFEYLWFYCIKGYYNNEIIHNLTEQLNCPVCAIMKITDDETNSSDIPYRIKFFWEQINSHFFDNTTNYTSLEDTMLMQYTPLKKNTEENVLELFQQFVFVLRRIVDTKLSHLKYLRHLTMNKIENIYSVMPLGCMHTYQKSVGYYPVDCINSILIIDALAKEVCSHVDSNPVFKSGSSRSILLKSSSISFNSVYCVDPLYDFEAFANAQKKPSVSYIKQTFNSFLAHADNELLKILKCYKHVGPRIFNTSLDLMKRIPVLENILTKTDYYIDNIPHTHDIDPSRKSEVKNEEVLNNFMYLFLFSMFSNRVKAPQGKETYNLTKNLITFNPVQFWNDVQPKYDEGSVKTKVNLYNIPLIYFQWKEKLTSDVMIQEIFNSYNNYLYYDLKYSPETDNFLIMFSDKLDSFGLNTKIFNSVIRTPVCLRDFCRFSTVEESGWLQKYETKIIDEQTFNVKLDEVCVGAHKVKTQMKFFQEYSYLLDENIKEEVENTKICDGSINEIVDLQESPDLDINFEEAFIDLQTYPTHKNLIQECEKAPEPEQLLSYDIGTQALRITGHVTTFCSHDDVKVTVDNTRLLQQPKKCTVNITSNGNTLTLHSSKALKSESYVLSLVLQDGSRISFVVKKQDVQIAKRSADLEEIHEESEEEIKNVVYEAQKEQEKTTNELINPNIEQVVHLVDEEYFKDLFKNQLPLEYLPVSEDREELLEAILKAKEQNGAIYKINTESKYLKRLNCDVTVPIEHALKNIFPRDAFVCSDPKQYETHTKRFQSFNEDKSDLEIINAVDFRLCLPNGLFVRAHPGVIDKKNIMIKQEYIGDKPKLEPVQHEEFRLFSYHGFICIKKIDGTLTILKGNGDIIDFEKPNDGSGEGNSFKSCHCSTLDDYRNKLNKIFQDENSSDYFTSRRGHITHKQNHVLDKKLLELLENLDVPYLKKSITKFDGKKIKIQGNKISQKHLHHMTSQQDFFTEEIYFERSDDFKSTFERNGSQKILFPDGTLISNSVNIADELVDDFVYVTISFQYEHPNYATVTYDFNKTLKIILNNNVIIKKTVGQESFVVNMGNNIAVSVSKENVSFHKTCEACSGLFQCNLNIEPFYANKWNELDEFLHVQDTYEKHFYSDFVGNCSRKSEYIKGRVNSLNCNHCKGRNNYKKLFVINKDLTGEKFSTNESIEVTTKKEMALNPDSTVSCYRMLPNMGTKVIDSRKKHYISYCDRFFNNSMYKYFYRSVPKQEFYSTFRVYHNMFQRVQDIENHVLNIRQIYFSEFGDVFESKAIYNNVATLMTDLQDYHQANEKEKHAEKENIERMKKDEEEEKIRKKDALCPCIKRRITMADKLNNAKKISSEYKKRIRNKQVPCYFQSDFCRRLE